jgi:hypothetical protein
MADQAIPGLLGKPKAQSRPKSLYRLPAPDNREKIEGFSLNELRQEIRHNRVSFPSQVPVFAKHDRPDVQRKAVQLYFLFGWSCQRIAQRHGLLRQRIQQILSTWKRRAIETGYIQEIPPALPPLKAGKPSDSTGLFSGAAFHLLAPGSSPGFSAKVSTSADHKLF